MPKKRKMVLIDLTGDDSEPEGNVGASSTMRSAAVVATAAKDIVCSDTHDFLQCLAPPNDGQHLCPVHYWFSQAEIEGSLNPDISALSNTKLKAAVKEFAKVDVQFAAKFSKLLKGAPLSREQYLSIYRRAKILEMLKQLNLPAGELTDI